MAFDVFVDASELIEVDSLVPQKNQCLMAQLSSMQPIPCRVILRKPGCNDRSIDSIEDPLHPIIPYELQKHFVDSEQNRQIRSNADQHMWIEKKRWIMAIESEGSFMKGIVEVFLGVAVCQLRRIQRNIFYEVMEVVG